MISHFTKKSESTANKVALGLGSYSILACQRAGTVMTDADAFSIGGVNASGEYPRIPSLRGMIDSDTPLEARTKTMLNDTSKTMELIWSDEFNVNGRTFYPGDDPYFTALDIYYWQTQDLEVRQNVMTVGVDCSL